MPTGDYRPQVLTPTLYERGRATTATFPVYVDSVLTQPDSGTFTLYRPDTDKEVDAQSVSFAGSASTYAVTLGATETLGSGWTEEWTLVFGSVTKVFTRRALCVRYGTQHTVSSADLLVYHPELVNQYPAGSTTGETFVEAGERRVDAWLLSLDRRPELVIPDGGLHLVTVWACLAAWCRSLSTGENRWAALADFYETKFEAEKGNVVINYDADQDGRANEEPVRGMPGVVYLSRPPAHWSST